MDFGASFPAFGNRCLGPGSDTMGLTIGEDAGHHLHSMIPVTLSWFVFVYLALFLAGILILWIGYEMIRKKHANSVARARVFCRICGSRYIDISSAPLLKCPVCGSLNERSAPESR